MARQTRTAEMPFGVGINRATGDLAVDPRSMEVARNLVLRDRKYQVRWGIGNSTADLYTVTWDEDPPGSPTNEFSDVVCHVAHYIAAGVMAWIGYEKATGKVRLYSSNLLGSSLVFQKLLGTLAANLSEPPIFHTAEADSILLIAHDEPNVVNRLETYYWDKLNSVPASQVPAKLQANLDGNGNADVKFRGVITYKNWVFGWGFGTNTDKARPEVIRVCQPGNPVSWNANHYFVVGARDDGIISCGVGANTLVIFKGGSWYRIVGTDRSNWSVEFGEAVYGSWFPRGVLSMNGVIYFYSQEGPRMTNGLQASVDISSKVDLDAPTLVPTSEVPNKNLGWVVYVPYHREIWWGFPGATTTRILALSIREGGEEGQSRWTTHLLPVPMTTTATRSASEAAANPEAGEVDVITSDIIVGYHATDPYATNPGLANEVNLTWTYKTTTVGDEDVEIWLKVGAAAWYKYGEYKIQQTTGDKQRWLNVPTILWDAGGVPTIKVAFRLRRRGGYKTGYTSTNPDDWPAGARHTCTAFQVPQLTSMSYSPAKIKVYVSNPYGGVYSTSNWSLNLTLGKAAYTRPSSVNQVQVKVDIPGLLGYNNKGQTYTGTTPYIFKTSTLAAGNDSLTSWVESLDILASSGYENQVAACGRFEKTTAYLEFRHVSGVNAAVVTYLGKAATRTAMDLFLDDSSFTSTPPSNTIPALASTRYEWNNDMGEYHNLYGYLTGGTGLLYGSFTNNAYGTYVGAPSTLAFDAGASPSYIVSDLAIFNTSGVPTGTTGQFATYGPTWEIPRTVTASTSAKAWSWEGSDAACTATLSLTDLVGAVKTAVPLNSRTATFKGFTPGEYLAAGLNFTIERISPYEYRGNYKLLRGVTVDGSGEAAIEFSDAYWNNYGNAWHAWSVDDRVTFNLYSYTYGRVKVTSGVRRLFAYVASWWDEDLQDTTSATAVYVPGPWIDKSFRTTETACEPYGENPYIPWVPQE